MRRQGVVLNARDVRRGRQLIRWAAESAALAPQARALLGRGPEFAAQFAEAARLADPDGFISGTFVHEMVRAAYFGPTEAERMASEWEEAAWEREAESLHPLDWGTDEIAASWRRLASAIRYIGSA